jgi:anti-anti-sigma factor
MDGMNDGVARMEVSEAGPGHLVVRISGEIDLSSVDDVTDQVEILLARTVQRVDLNVTDLEFMDSSGIALLLRITNRFGPIDLIGANPLIRRVIEATGLTDILRVPE